MYNVFILIYFVEQSIIVNKDVHVFEIKKPSLNKTYKTTVKLLFA